MTQPIPIAGRGAVTTIGGDPIQEAAKLVALILERRSREKRGAAERRGVEERKTAGAQATAAVEQARGLPAAQEAEAFERVHGRPPREGEIIGGPGAEAQRKMQMATRDALDDPTLLALLGETAAIQAVGGKLTSASGQIAGARAERERNLFTFENLQSARDTFEAMPQEQQRDARLFATLQAVPDQIVTLGADARLRQAVMKEALSVMTEDDNALAKFIEENAPGGITAGNLVGASAVGINQLLTSVFSLSVTESDWTKSRNDVLQQLSSESKIPFALLDGAMRAKESGITRAEVPPRFQMAFDFLDAGAAANFQVMMGEAFTASPAFQTTRTLIELGRQADPKSPTFRNLANIYTGMIKWAMLQQSPDFPRLQRDMGSDDEATRTAATNQLQLELNRLEALVPTLEKARFRSITRAAPGAPGGTPGLQLSAEDMIDQLLDELERRGMTLAAPEAGAGGMPPQIP